MASSWGFVRYSDIMRNLAKPLIVAAVLLSSVVTLSGCSGEGGPKAGSPETGDIYQNSETVEGLIYYAAGSVGDGADDARVSIKPIGGQSANDLTGESGTDTLLPFTLTTGGAEGETVRMTVESLSSDGEVECQISYRDIIIHNTASGDHAVAVCEGKLTAWENVNL